MNRFGAMSVGAAIWLGLMFCGGCAEPALEEAQTESSNIQEQNEKPVSEPPRFLGGDRPASYLLPANYDPEIAMPLVILLHGFTGTAVGQDTYFGLSQVTQARGIMLLMPDGKVNPDGNQFWNATDFCCDFYRSGVDDVAYISGLIDEAQSLFNIDSRKVYLVGHSNGGYMSYRMACDRSEQITGIVSLAGTTWANPEDCGNPEPVAVLQVHGTWDSTILYRGKATREADPTGEAVDAQSCLASECTEPMDTCDSDPECQQMWSCFERCDSVANEDQCNAACWAAAPKASQGNWMEAFLCGLESACWDDPTWPQPGYSGAEEAVARWAERNGCDVSVEEGTAADIVVDLPGTDTSTFNYQNCPQGRQASLWKIESGSHVPFFNGNWSASIVDWLLSQSKAE